MKTLMKNEKLKTINIYLTYEDKKRLIDLKNKYHLSLSTLCRIITEKISLVMGNQLEETYLYEEQGRKTSIKPRATFKYEKPSMAYTNAVKIFLKKDLGKYVENEKKKSKCLNFIYQEFEETYEENYDGNHFTRMMTRYIKRNPEYVKKILEKQEL